MAVVTLTVTEAGYHLDGAGHLDLGHPEVAADLVRLRPGPGAAARPARTMPGRLAAGLAARRRSGAGPITVVPCDNLMGNGAVTRDVVLEICEAVDPSLTGWVAANVSFVSTVVDRITPSTLVEDLALVERAIGREDRAAVVAEPFSEWVLAGEFPAGRPDWVSAGARLVTDVAPFAERKLGLLNGGHSLLAYAGSSLGHSTVAGAVADPRCRAWLEEWWDGVAGVLPLPADEVARYRLALLDRWTNPRIGHALSAVARDGSLKLVQRVLPVIHRYRAIGEPPPPGAARHPRRLAGSPPGLRRGDQRSARRRAGPAGRRGTVGRGPRPSRRTRARTGGGPRPGARGRRDLPGARGHAWMRPRREAEVDAPPALPGGCGMTQQAVFRP